LSFIYLAYKLDDSGALFVSRKEHEEVKERNEIKNTIKFANAGRI
jgi:hypothetical protein